MPEVVRQAVAAAQAGELDRADDLLSDALRQCPDHPELLAELAGLRFRQGRMAEAEVLVTRLVEVDPGAEYGWELLGTLRYLRDDPMGALQAWTRSGSPLIRSVEIPVRGPAGPRDDGLEPRTLGVAGLEPGQPLRPEVLIRGTRRLEALPAASRARVGYVMLPGGEAQVDGALVLMPRFPFSRLKLAEHGARLLTGSVDLAFGDLMGHLERWELSGVREGTLRRGTLALAHPAPADAGVWRWTVEHRVGRYGTPLHGDERAGEVRRIERSRAGWGHTHWLTARLRGTVRSGVEVRRARGTYVAGGVGAAALPLGAWGSMRLDAEGWTRVARSEGEDPAPTESRRFGRLEVEAAVHPAGVGGAGSLPRILARVGFISVSRGTPADLSPRMGKEGNTRVLMRAVSDLDADGVVQPRFPGRSWIHGSVEVGRRVARVGPVEIGVAAFSDGVRVLARGDAGGPGTERRSAIHLGTGVRARLPGVNGRLRLDWAIDPSDGTSALSAAWVPGTFPVP